MSLLRESFYGFPWMIRESRLIEFAEILPRLSIDPQQLNCMPGNDECELFEVVSNVAVIKIHGALSKRESFWSRLFGGTSYDQIAAAIYKAVADSNIRGIVLDIDSPGGAALGCCELADQIYAARAAKKIVTVANAQMCSAALFLGTASSEVVVTKSAMSGSMGVLLPRIDWSKAEQAAGYQTIFIKSGEAKTDGQPSEPFTDAEGKRLQAVVDSLFEQFLGSVATYRGTDPETLRAAAGDAGVFIGQEAVAAGLADRVGTLRDVIAELSRDPNPDLSDSQGVDYDTGEPPDGPSNPEGRRPARYARRIERRVGH